MIKKTGLAPSFGADIIDFYVVTDVTRQLEKGIVKVKSFDFKHVFPNQEVEFAEEIAGDEVFRIKVKLNKEDSETADPASYVHHEWVETQPDRYTLKIKNITGSPVYVALEEEGTL